MTRPAVIMPGQKMKIASTLTGPPPPCYRLAGVSSPLCPQLSVMHFFGSKRKDKGFQYQHNRLSNPLCSEFGIHNREQLAHFIEVELPDFRLVRRDRLRGKCSTP